MTTEPQATIETLGLTVSAEFVPFSKSRNAVKSPEGFPRAPETASELSLNWRVTVRCMDRYVLATDYQQGIGYAPAYKASVKDLGGQNCIMRFKAMHEEAETGRAARIPNRFGTGKALPAPSAADVLYSLTMDADVLNYSRFEDWAENLGYEPDSRKAEGIYRDCLGLALQLRNGIGEKALSDLQTAFQDY